jgi:two-component system NtrC family sensor kinase
MASDTVLHLLESQIDDNPKLKKRITLLKECNSRIQNIVNNLKEFSRYAEFEFTAMDINDAVFAVLAIAGQQLLNQAIEVELRLGENLPRLLGDKNQIEQVLLNLISNARDAMEESSRKLLTIQTNLSRKGQKIELRVSDTGLGMTSEQIEQIFNPFFTTKDYDRGTGLGLSICYRIVDAHRGKIEVKSQLNKGTTFIVRLPTTQNSGGNNVL